MTSASLTRPTHPTTTTPSSGEYWFDSGAADRVVLFFERYLRHIKGQWAGQPFVLHDWQRDQIIRPLFGWKRPDGTRRYRTAYIEVPRKNGKSTLSAGIALYLLYGDREPGAEVYSAAGDRDQAAIVFDAAKQMVEVSRALSKRGDVYKRTIVYPKLRSFYKVLSADVPTKHGLNAHGIIFDELHVQRTRDLYDTMTTSTGSRRQPVTVLITTAGVDQTSICYEMHDYADKVIRGVIADDTFLGLIYAAEKTEDWQDPTTWAKANPGLGLTVSEDYLATEARKAAEIPAYQNTFRRLHLNQWTQQVDRWIDLTLWDTQAASVPEDALAGRTCYGGLDLASVSDLVAWVMVFPREDDIEAIDVLARFWCPEAKLHDTTNRYRDQYQAWARAGYLKTTPGDAIDYAFVRKQILEDGSRFRIVDLNVDRLFQAHQLSMELISEGMKVVGMGMGFLSMAAPMKEFERLLLSQKVHHGGNPVLRWMADNVAVKQDPAGNLKPDKAASQGKIDGIVALVESIDRAQRHRIGSVYDRRGLTIV